LEVFFSETIKRIQILILLLQEGYIDLSALLKTHLDAGSAEVVRDEMVAHGARLWANGVQIELSI